MKHYANLNLNNVQHWAVFCVVLSLCLPEAVGRGLTSHDESMFFLNVLNLTWQKFVYICTVYTLGVSCAHLTMGLHCIFHYDGFKSWIMSVYLLTEEQKNILH